MKQVKFIFGALFVVIAIWALIIPSLALAGKNKAEAPTAKAPVIFAAVEVEMGNDKELHISGHNLVDDNEDGHECPEVSLGDFPIKPDEITCTAGAGGPDLVTIKLSGEESGGLSLNIMNQGGTGRFEVAFGTDGTDGAGVLVGKGPGATSREAAGDGEVSRVLQNYGVNGESFAQRFVACTQVQDIEIVWGDCNHQGTIPISGSDISDNHTNALKSSQFCYWSTFHPGAIAPFPGDAQFQARILCVKIVAPAAEMQ